MNSLDSTAKSLTIRVKLCHLIEIVSFTFFQYLVYTFLNPIQLMHHSRDLSFRQEIQFRNQLAEHLTGWVNGQMNIAANTSHKENVQK